MTDHTTIPRFQAPWRRFFAQGLGIALYGVRIRWETEVDPDQGYAREFFSLEKVSE